MRCVDSPEGDGWKGAEKGACHPALGRQKMVVEDMEYMGPVRSMDVVASEQKILNILVNLINDGEIDGNNYSHLSAFM